MTTKKVKILFDHQTFSIQPYGGISRYFNQLINGIDSTNYHQAELAIWRSDNVYLNKIAPFSKIVFKGRRRMLYKINQYYSECKIKKGQFDILHITYYDPYFISLVSGKPFVMTIHDMVHERLHKQYPALKPDHYVMGKRILAKKAAAIITVSEFTRQDVISLLSIDPSRVHVIHHASSIRDSLTRELSGDAKSYILYVGNRGNYKNFKGLLNAFAMVSVCPSIDLVCAGGGPFSSEEKVWIKTLGLTNKVHQKEFRSDHVLEALYSGATAFIFPSIYEGFGIPVLEAFSCNCPCIVSNAGALPEIAGDAALYIDPLDSKSIAQAIERITNDDELRTSLIKRGQNRLSMFSWQKAVSQTLELYNKTI